MSSEGKKLFNIIILGVSFMFIFTAFQSCGNIAQTVITNLNNTDFHGSGYTSMSIIYGVLSASNLISPSLVAIVGPQFSMVVSGVFYSLYIAVFIQPSAWAFYTASVLIGIAAAVLWTAQGNCLTENSDENTIGRNSGIFWALLQFSLIFGNMYIYFAWQGKTHISAFAWQRMRGTSLICRYFISTIKLRQEFASSSMWKRAIAELSSLL